MFTIDLALKNIPLPISVQRKESEEAEALYQKIVSAMRSQPPILVELTCEKDTDRKIAVLSDSIIAVIISKKSGAASSGRVPGFFAAAFPESE
jgi:hypothetical protein